jgi:hypothetical protein
MISFRVSDRQPCRRFRESSPANESERRRACSRRPERPTADRRNLARALDTVTGHARADDRRTRSNGFRPAKRKSALTRAEKQPAPIDREGDATENPQQNPAHTAPTRPPRPHAATGETGHTAPRSIATGPDRARPRLIAAGRDETRDETRQPPPHARTEAEQRRIPLRHTPSRRNHAKAKAGHREDSQAPRHTRDRHPEEQHLRQRRHSDPRRVCPASDVPQRP